MDALIHINDYINSLPVSKSIDIQDLHHMIMEMMPQSKLWFLDGRDDKGKIIANPNIGYGTHTIKYADGKTKEFYQIGISANTSGISVYIMGIEDKNFLPERYGKTIGKAIVTGYCIKFKALKDINTDVLKDAIRSGLEPRPD